MTKQHSTGALTEEQHQQQDKIYAEGHDYDYLIIGAGSSALTVGSLLAKKGYKICMLEAHDIPGGYAHTFKMGDWSFCAQVHYILGCGREEHIYSFLKHLGLEKEITFELMGPEGGYDLVSLPDGKRVFIPYGFDQMEKNIEEAYPGQGKAAGRFLKEIQIIFAELLQLPAKKITWWLYLTKWWKFPHLIKYRGSTLKDLLDKFGVAKEARAILTADAGDLGLPPAKLSIFPYASLFSGYNRGSYYPTKHFKFYTQGLADFITSHSGCHIFYETEATKINVEGDQVVGVETKDGKVFKAKNYICNMDPKSAAKRLIGWEKFPKKYTKKLDYEYSYSGFIIYLGLKDIDLRDYGFGSYNIWHLEDWDMDKMCERQGNYNFDKPWFFLTTPTLHTDDPGNSPKGGQILEISTYAKFDKFEEFQKKGYTEYNKFKLDIAVKLLDLVEEKFIPNLRDHIVLQLVGSPMTNVDYCMAPKGNCYGSSMTPKQIAYNRLKADTPWQNFWWCNASSGFGGISGTVSTGMKLYMKLTGDHFYDTHKLPSDEELVRQAQERLRKKTEKQNKKGLKY